MVLKHRYKQFKEENLQKNYVLRKGFNFEKDGHVSQGEVSSIKGRIPLL